jgi:hypothetical protein
MEAKSRPEWHAVLAEFIIESDQRVLDWRISSSFMRASWIRLPSGIS